MTAASSMMNCLMDASMKGLTDGSMEPSMNAAMNPRMKPSMKGLVVSLMEPSMDGSMDGSMGSSMNALTDASIDAVPVEILEMIVMNLDPEFAWNSFRLTSKRSKAVVENSFYWKQQLLRLGSSRCLNLSQKDVNGIAQSVIRARRTISNWSQKTGGIGFLDQKDSTRMIESFVFADCFDVLHHAGSRSLIAGFRDKSIKVWRVADQTPLAQVTDAHNGWIKFIKAVPHTDQFVSIGYDGSVKKWRLVGRQVVPLSEICVTSPVKQVQMASSQLFALSTDKKIRVIEFTDELRLRWNIQYFKGQTTAMAVAEGTDSSLYLAGSNSWICRLDTKSWKRVCGVKLSSVVTAMQVFEEKVYCGLSDGCLTVLDLDLAVSSQIQVFSAQISFSSLQLGLGLMFCVSVNGAVAIYSCFEEIFRGSVGGKVVDAKLAGDEMVVITSTGKIAVYSSKKNSFQTSADPLRHAPSKKL